MTPSTLAAGLGLVPWLFSGLLLISLAFLAWKIGIPAVKILALEQHVKKLDIELRGEKDRAKVAELINNDLRNRNEQLMKELTDTKQQLTTVLDAIEIKVKVEAIKAVRQAADHLQPEETP